MPKITPSLWFDHNLAETVKFHTANFKDSKVLEICRYDECTGHHGGWLAAHFFEPTFDPPNIP